MAALPNGTIDSKTDIEDTRPMLFDICPHR